MRVLIFVIIILFNCTFEQQLWNGNIVCGIVPPSSSKDCFVSNLDTGFKCCRVWNIPGQSDTCVLLSDFQIKNGNFSQKISPNYDCGSSFSYFSIGYIIAVITFLF